MKKATRFFVIMLAIVLVPSAAVAGNFGSISGGPHLAASDWVRYQYESLGTEMTNATDWSLNNQYGPDTDLEVGTTTSDGDTDVFVRDDDYGLNEKYAWVDCPSTATTGGSHPYKWCYGQILRYNNGRYPGGYDTWDRRRHQACHELGHTVGLRHITTSTGTGSNSCMSSLYLTQFELFDHNKGEINAYYQ